MLPNGKLGKFQIKIRGQGIELRAAFIKASVADEILADGIEESVLLELIGGEPDWEGIFRAKIYVNGHLEESLQLESPADIPLANESQENWLLVLRHLVSGTFQVLHGNGEFNQELLTHHSETSHFHGIPVSKLCVEYGLDGTEWEFRRTRAQSLVVFLLGPSGQRYRLDSLKRKENLLIVADSE